MGNGPPVSGRIQRRFRRGCTHAFGATGVGRPGRWRRWRTQAPFLRVGLRHADAIRPAHRLALMADVPEFHPPPAGGPARGWHYVGPLTDRPRPESHVACLDDGWDTSRPLVYLTLGSSGRPADYLPGLIDTFAASPYRLVVTTGGRAGVPPVPDGVRVFDYLPGEWILARAQVLLGVVGIGAIYQALRQARPVLCWAEHADQRAHLARVEALGLGRRLWSRRLSSGGRGAPPAGGPSPEPAQVLEAIDELLAEGDALRTRCRAFAVHLTARDGGEVAADVFERHLESAPPPRPPRLGPPA
ncbi:MAG: hypothetical protein CMJ84_06990, partial [Planctomycetes bacterium]|nr:hypothetical protein [Planctomycetota bacterium]